MAHPRKKAPRQVTRYRHDAHDPVTPETGHSDRLVNEEVVTVEMNNGWSGGLDVFRLETDKTVIVDLDPAVDPVLLWSGKQNRREVPVLPLQRNEIVSDSRIVRIIERARQNAGAADPAQPSLFVELEKELRENTKEVRVEFYTHEEEWRNKLICGDSLPVMESLMRYERLAGSVQTIYFDPPYGIKYDSNFQQRIGNSKNDQADQADDVLTIKAFRDTWTLGTHSYLSYLADRLYLCRDLLTNTGSIFVQMDDANLPFVWSLMGEVFGVENFVALVPFRKKTMPLGAKTLEQMNNFLVWFAKRKKDDQGALNVFYRQLYSRPDVQGDFHWCWYETPHGERARMSDEQLNDHRKLPKGSRIYRLVSMYPPTYSASSVFGFDFDGQEYHPPRGACWVTNPDGMARLASQGRIQVEGKHLRFRLYLDDGSISKLTAFWGDTIGARDKDYAVQTSLEVVRRCIAMTSAPGDLVFDPTSGSGTTAVAAEMLGRRWIACDVSRVGINVARRRLMQQAFDHYALADADRIAGDFEYKSIDVTSLKTIANDQEPESVRLYNEPIVDRNAVRVTGPFEVMTVGRYSKGDWLGTVSGEPDSGQLQDYVEVMCHLYRPNATLLADGGPVHAVMGEGLQQIGISVGPLTGRVTARQLIDVAASARDLGVPEVHVLGWAFEANVGEVKERLEDENGVAIALVMIRPDALVEGLQVTDREMLFSPFALPEVRVESLGSTGYQAHVDGVTTFDRATRTTSYIPADSGYVAAWYLDEDYDGDCFVDCQMFFEFKKAPNLGAAAGVDIDSDEFDLRFSSDPFPVGKYGQVAVKVVDVYGNESTVVRELRA